MKKFVLALIIFLSGTAPCYSASLLYGNDAQGNLFTINIATGAGSLVGVLPDGPYLRPRYSGYNEIEYDNLNDRAWAQQRDANFAAQEFDINTAAGIGIPIPNGYSWHGMEFVDGTLYAAGFLTHNSSSSSWATLDPTSGTAIIIGADSIPVAITGLAYSYYRSGIRPHF